MRRRSLIVAVAVVLVAAGFSVATLVSTDSAGAQGATTAQDTTTAGGESTQDAKDLNDVFWTVFLLSVLVAAVWSIPFILDVVLAYRNNAKRLDRLIPEYHRVVTEASKKELTVEELRELIRAADLTYRPARGMSGMTRGLFAFAVLATVSTVLFALVALGRPEDDDIVQSIVAALVGAFSAIVGVYYGSRTAESATETAAASARQSGLVPPGDEGDSTATGTRGTGGTGDPSGKDKK